MENFRICNLKDNKQYCREIAILEHNEWGKVHRKLKKRRKAVFY